MRRRQLFDPDTGTYTYLVWDPASRQAALIDPVREQLERDLALVRELGLTLAWALETHVHADHITSAGALRRETGCSVAFAASDPVPGADVLLDDGARVSLGEAALVARHTPGHTVGSLVFVTDDASAVFTGDTLLIRGCGRTDFQGGSASALYHSVNSVLFALPDDCVVLPGHDYKGRTESTIGEERVHNPRLRDGTTEAFFVALMDALDLSPPRRIHEAVPANVHAGLPPSDEPQASGGQHAVG